jgi:hypothetical protein
MQAREKEQRTSQEPYCYVITMDDSAIKQATSFVGCVAALASPCPSADRTAFLKPLALSGPMALML